MANIDKVSVKNTVYNIVSPAVVSDYIEVIGGACTKPDGYVEDEVILAKQNDVQLLFKATQTIAFGANIVENTNCVRTTLEEVLKNAGGGGGASSADQVSYDNTTSGLLADNVQEALDEVQGNVVSVNQTLTNQVKDMNNVYGSKNLLILTSYSKGETVSLNGGTIKCNDDGSYTINGTFTSDATLKIDWLVRADRREISNLAGKILTASCNGYNTSDIQFYTGCFKTDGTASQVGSGAYGETPRQYTMPSDAYTFRNWISIAAKTYSNVTIYPMVCLASVYELSPDWQSPSETNQQLTKDTTALLDNLEVNGAVNMLNFAQASEVVKGYTFTNTDGVVQVTGSRASGETGNADHDKTITLPKGTYKVSGCPSGGGENTWRLLVNINNGAKYALDYGDGAVFTLTEESTLRVYCSIMANYSDTVNLTFYPMITVPSYNGDYVPYAKSNRELTDELTIGTVSATRNTDYLNGTNAVTFRKYGKMVSCEGYFQVTTAAVRNGVLYTLAELPLASSFLLALKNTGEFGLLNVKPNGTVVVESEDGLPIGFYSLIGTFVLA